MNEQFAKFRSIFSRFFAKKHISISIKYKIDFLEQLGNLLASGIPITNSLKIIKYQTKNKTFKRVLDDILDMTNKGSNFQECASKFPKIFNQFDLSIIEMGEVTGKLDQSIETIRKKEEKTKELRSKILSALIYPIIVISLSVAMIGVFMIYVIPKIEKMYKDAKVNLPDITRTVINIAKFLQENYILILCILIICIIIAQFFKKYPRTKLYYDAFILKIPLFGQLIQKRILTTFSSGLGVLLGSGVMINKSLEIASLSVENSYYEKEIARINKEVSEGKDLSTLLGINAIAEGKENHFFPLDLAGAVKIGEQTGKLPESFMRISQKYEKEIDTVVKNMQTMIEPLVIVVVGLIIGVLIMAIMLPFFNMVNVI